MILIEGFNEGILAAKLIHPMSLLIVVITTLAAITLSGLWASNNLLRIVFLLLATFWGIKGIIIGFLVTIIYWDP